MFTALFVNKQEFVLCVILLNTAKSRSFVFDRYSDQADLKMFQMIKSKCILNTSLKGHVFPLFSPQHFIYKTDSENEDRLK